MCVEFLSEGSEEEEISDTASSFDTRSAPCTNTHMPAAFLLRAKIPVADGFPLEQVAGIAVHPC